MHLVLELNKAWVPCLRVQRLGLALDTGHTKGPEGKNDFSMEPVVELS